MLFRELKSPLSKRLYRYLDKLFNPPKHIRLKFDLKTLCYEHLAMPRSKDTYQLRKDIESAAKELEEIDFLERSTKSERIKKISSGRYEITFKKKLTTKKPDSIALTTAPSPNNGLSQMLQDRGVSEKIASEIASSDEYSEEFILERIEIHDWLKKRKDSRVSKNAAGYLVTSIRQGYERPDGFEPQAETDKKKQRTQIA